MSNPKSLQDDTLAARTKRFGRLLRRKFREARETLLAQRNSIAVFVINPAPVGYRVIIAARLTICLRVDAQ